MNKKDISYVNSVLDEAKKNPYYVTCIIIEGFEFQIHWKDDKCYYFAKMFFNPNWGHSHGVYGRTKDEFISNMTYEIEESKKIYVNGGKYPSNYYNKR